MWFLRSHTHWRNKSRNNQALFNNIVCVSRARCITIYRITVCVRNQAKCVPCLSSSKPSVHVDYRCCHASHVVRTREWFQIKYVINGCKYAIYFDISAMFSGQSLWKYISTYIKTFNHAWLSPRRKLNSFNSFHEW